MRPNIKRGMSLIELLIVVFIITLLLQLALPAVEMSRESARQTQCANNLRQIGLASLVHHDQHGFFPSGGWMPFWVGDSLRGTGKDQPGGWIYNLLPYVEHEDVYRLPDDGNADRITAEQKATSATMAGIAIPIFQCPSRRRAVPYPYILGADWDVINCDRPKKVARSDYAANGGDEFDDDFPFFDSISEYDHSLYSSMDRAAAWSSTFNMTGVCFVRSEIGIHQVIDGTSKTYLVGEKFLNPSFYHNGWDPGDNHSMYQGFDRDIIRWADKRFPPLRDSEAVDSSVNFGSAHINGFYLVMCDGSVRQMYYDVDEAVHRAYANRHDAPKR